MSGMRWGVEDARLVGAVGALLVAVGSSAALVAGPGFGALLGGVLFTWLAGRVAGGRRGAVAASTGLLLLVGLAAARLTWSMGLTWAAVAGLLAVSLALGLRGRRLRVPGGAAWGLVAAASSAGPLLGLGPYPSSIVLMAYGLAEMVMWGSLA